MLKESYKCSDDFTRQLLFNFRQKDFRKKVYIKVKDDIIMAAHADNITRFQNLSLSDKIYQYSSTWFPILHSTDFRVGTAWQGWQIPNFDTYFEYDRQKDVVRIKTFQRQKISLDFYQESVQKIIDKNILSVFAKEKGKKIMIAYSGGIDSLTILSYIIKNKLQEKVILVNFANLFTTSEKKINNLALEKKLGFETLQIKIDISDFIESCNTKNFLQASCYCTRTLLKRFKGHSFMFAYNGNQTLLHKSIYLEQINKKVAKAGYCQTMNNWTPVEKPIPLKEHLLTSRAWHKLNGLYGGSIYDPIGSEETIEMVRALDWSQIDPLVVSDAKIARAVIKKNVGDKLDELITEEDHLELDNVDYDYKFSLDKFDTDIFITPKKYYYHNKELYAKFLTGYAQCKKQNTISYGSLFNHLFLKTYLKKNGI